MLESLIVDDEARRRTLERYRRTEKYAKTQERYLATPKGQTYLTEKRQRHRQKRLTVEQAGTLTRHEQRVVFHAYRKHCAYCDATGIPLTIDHVIPLTQGGEHVRTNVVPSCADCNQKKGTDRWVPNPPRGRLAF